MSYIFLKFLENLTLYLKFSFDKVFIANFVLNSPNKYNFSLKCFKIIWKDIKKGNFWEIYYKKVKFWKKNLKDLQKKSYKGEFLENCL